MKSSNAGAPTKYRAEYCQKIIDWFNVPLFTLRTEEYIDPEGNKKIKQIKEVANFPTLEGFACSIGVDVDTLKNWADAIDKKGKRLHQEFFGAMGKAKAYQKNLWQQNSMLGRYNSGFTIFLGKNVFGWTEKQEIDHTSLGEKLEIGLVTYTPKDAKDNHSS